MKAKTYYTSIILMLMGILVWDNLFTYQQIQAEDVELSIELKLESSDSKGNESSKNEEEFQKEVKIFESNHISLIQKQVPIFMSASHYDRCFSYPRIEVLTPPPNFV